MREERKFDFLDPLKAQMAVDCAEARALFDQIQL
jgi:FAD synthase